MAHRLSSSECPFLHCCVLSVSFFFRLRGENRSASPFEHRKTNHWKAEIRLEIALVVEALLAYCAFIDKAFYSVYQHSILLTRSLAQGASSGEDTLWQELQTFAGACRQYLYCRPVKLVN